MPQADTEDLLATSQQPPLPNPFPSPQRSLLASPGTAKAARLQRLCELLQRQRRALLHEWQLAARSDVVDDDLLPARQHVEDGLVAVDVALENMRRGGYGRCAGCGGEIDFQRLLVLPTATCCWRCLRGRKALSATGATISVAGGVRAARSPR